MATFIKTDHGTWVEEQSALRAMLFGTPVVEYVKRDGLMIPLDEYWQAVKGE